MEKRKWRRAVARGISGTVLRTNLALALFLAAATVPSAQEPQPAPEPAKRIDLNKASAQELDRLPEIGPKLAKAIVEFRKRSGPFRRVEDLLAVPGISKRRLEKIRPFVFVEDAKKSDAETQPSELRTPYSKFSGKSVRLSEA